MIVDWEPLSQAKSIRPKNEQAKAGAAESKESLTQQVELLL